MIHQLFSQCLHAFIRTAPAPEADPVFGRLQWLGNDWWSGQVHPQPAPAFLAAGTMHVLIRAGRRGPSARQRRHYQHVTSQYDILWPGIATALATSHPLMWDEVTLRDHLDIPTLCLPPLDHDGPPQWALDYTFAPGTGGAKSYTVHFHEWDLTEVTEAEEAGVLV